MKGARNSARVGSGFGERGARDDAPAPDLHVRRDELVAQYRRYAVKIARSIAASLPINVEIDDLAGWGYLGLIEAATRYDASRGVKFRSYAHHRIRGAILDGLRREFGGSAPPEEREKGEGLRDRARAEVCLDAGFALDDLCGEGGRGRPEDPFSVPGAVFDSPDRGTWLGEVRVRLEDAMCVLTPLERMLVHHYYVNGETVQSLARELNLSKSWLSRVHARALAKLRVRLLEQTADREAFV
jgi:RNA polymerase sigma factor for flagellar operon FliA